MVVAADVRNSMNMLKASTSAKARCRAQAGVRTHPFDGEIAADIRARLVEPAAAIAIGQPISHRIDHMLSGVRSQIAIKIFGEDLDTLRGQADALRARSRHPGSRIKIESKCSRRRSGAHRLCRSGPLWRAGTADPGEAGTSSRGEKSHADRRRWKAFRAGRAPARIGALRSRGSREILIRNADRPRPVVETRVDRGWRRAEPDQPRRRQAPHRAVGQCASARSRRSSRTSRAVVADMKLPGGYFITLGGQFQAQEEASRPGRAAVDRVARADVRRALQPLQVGAALGADHGQHSARAGGAVIGLWVQASPCRSPALIGFITLAGISVRNGILKVSHYINLMRIEGERFDHQMILRGSLERLSPVLMTALVTAFALAPLLFEAERPGTEDPAPGGGGHLLRADQLDAARYLLTRRCSGYSDVGRRAAW